MRVDDEEFVETVFQSQSLNLSYKNQDEKRFDKVSYPLRATSYYPLLPPTSVK